jgi:hypothetical protein
MATASKGKRVDATTLTNWDLSQDEFRRLARTGSAADLEAAGEARRERQRQEQQPEPEPQPAPEPEPQPEPQPAA